MKSSIFINVDDLMTTGRSPFLQVRLIHPSHQVNQLGIGLRAIQAQEITVMTGFDG